MAFITLASLNDSRIVFVSVYFLLSESERWRGQANSGAAGTRLEFQYPPLTGAASLSDEYSDCLNFTNWLRLWNLKALHHHWASDRASANTLSPWQWHVVLLVVMISMISGHVTGSCGDVTRKCLWIRPGRTQSFSVFMSFYWLTQCFDIANLAHHDFVRLICIIVFPLHRPMWHWVVLARWTVFVCSISTRNLCALIHALLIFIVNSAIPTLIARQHWRERLMTGTNFFEE